MRNMKRMIATVLCVLSLITVFAIGFADDANVTSKVSATEVKVGDTVTMTVAIKETTVSSLGVAVSVPSGFEVVSGEWLQNGAMATYDMSKNKGAFSPGSAKAISGDVFKVTLKAKTAGASAQNITINVIAKNGSAEIFNSNGTKSVTIRCATHTFGAWSKLDAKHERTCSTCSYKESANHTWDSGKQTGAPSCTKEGEKTFTCTTCQATKKEPIAKLPHTYGAWTKLSDTQHEHKCSCGASEKANHKWDAGKVTTPATCSKEGVKTYTCSDCKATKTESVAKLAHTYDNSCDNTCNKCNATRDAGHKWSSSWTSDSKNHWHKCSTCGATKDSAAHTASDWIVDKEATDTAAGSKHKECTVCKKTVQTESIPAKGCKHTAGTKMVNQSDATCEAEGYTGDKVCKNCNTVMEKGKIIDALGHDIELQNAKEGTCQEDGYTGDEYCKTCKKVVKQGEVIPKGEHNVETTDAKEATCTEEGFTGKKTCKTCGEVTDEGSVTPKAEHEYVDGVCKNCNTKDPDYVPSTEPTEPTTPTDPEEPKNNTVWIIVGASVGVLALAGIIFFVVFKRKKEDEE